MISIDEFIKGGGEGLLGEIQSIVKKIRADIEECKPEEEIVHALTQMIREGFEATSQVIDEVGKIPHPLAGRVLQKLFEISPDKKVRKAIKRSLYRLKSRGIPVEEIHFDRKGPVLKPLQAEPAKGFGGPFDFLGQRFLMLTVPHIGRGMTVIQGIISDTEGLVDFSGGEMARKRFKEFFDEIQKGGPFPLMEMEPSYAGFLLFKAYRLTLNRGRTPPQEYLQLKKEIETIKRDYERSPVYSLIREDEIEEGRLFERGGDLLKTDLFSSWRLEEKEIRPYAEEVWDAEESKLILSRAQKEARFQEIYQRALSDLFPEERRSLYRMRMEEMAYYLLKWGREEEAKISLAVAADLKKPPNVIHPNPFLFQLVVKSIFGLLSEAYEKKKEEFSLIWKP